MVGLKGRITKLEHDTAGYKTTLVCPECGAEFVVHRDASLQYLCWEWERASGNKTSRETPADVALLIEHEHDATEFIDKATGEPFVGELLRGMGRMLREDVPDLSE
jgi:hypothetical protein